MDLTKIVYTAITLALGGSLSFSTWAAVSIWEIKANLNVQNVVNQQFDKRLTVQQAQIGVFENVLGEIKADVKVIKALMEERERPKHQ